MGASARGLWTVVGRTTPACVALWWVAAVACAEPAPDVRSVSSTSADLLETLAVAGYRDWPAPPTSADLPRRRGARGPHGAFVEVFLDPVLLEAFDSGDVLPAWPVGVAAVCESYADEEAAEAELYNVMVKGDHGWTWAQLDGAGRALDTAGASDCIGCHGAADDFVFSLFLRE